MNVSSWSQLLFWRDEHESVTQGRVFSRVVELGWEETEVCECRVCVFACVWGEDQSEVVWETVVTAPNLLYQPPSVLTDRVSFSKRNCHQPFYCSSQPVSSPSRFLLTASLSSQPTLVFFNTHVLCHTMEVPLLCWIPLPNPFVEISFLPVVCVNHITLSVIVFKFSCHVSPKTHQLAFPAQILCPSIPNRAVSVSSVVTVSYLTLKSVKAK